MTNYRRIQLPSFLLASSVSVMSNPPKLSDEARAAALAKATEARKARRELKHLLKMRSLTLAEVLERADSDEIVAKTKTLAVIESLPGVGKVKARRAMEDIGIAENRRLRGLGQKQRAELLNRFG